MKKKPDRRSIRFATFTVLALAVSGIAVVAPATATPPVESAPPPAAEPAAAPRTEEVAAGTDLGKNCSKTSLEILEGLLEMGGTDKVTTVRHRGDIDADTPENSLAAFRNSYQACRPGIETDIRKTKDGQFVLFHDTKIGKMLEPATTRKPILARMRLWIR